MVVRSYRAAFEVERRLHRIDRYRVPVPYGVPLQELAYGLACLTLVVILSGAPLVGTALLHVPWPMRLILLPAAGARLLRRTGSDGRPAHEVLVARLLRVTRPRALAGFVRACDSRQLVELADVTVARDDRATRYERGEVRGPVTVVLCAPARMTIRGHRTELRALGATPLLEPHVLDVAARSRLVIR